MDIRVDYDELTALHTGLMNMRDVTRQRSYDLFATHDQVRAFWVGASSNSYSNWWQNVDYPARYRLEGELESLATKITLIRSIVQQHDQDCAAIVKQLMAGS